MSDKVNGVFGFGAFAFLIFTIFDAYRMAETRTRQRIGPGVTTEVEAQQDKIIIGWGIFLILLGMLFLLQNLIPYAFLGRLWPLVFILLGAYLVYRALRSREDRSRISPPSVTESKKEDIWNVHSLQFCRTDGGFDIDRFGRNLPDRELLCLFLRLAFDFTILASDPDNRWIEKAL
jgi:hypothetical protein